MPTLSPRPSETLPLPKVVLFDMDDTIFDHSLTCRRALARLRREHDYFQGHSLDELWREYLRLLYVGHAEVMLGRRTSQEVRAERFLGIAAWSGHRAGAEEGARLARDYREYYQELRRPIAGAPEFLQRLHGRTQLGIVTNNTVSEQTERISFLGLEGTIDFLVTSEEVGVGKPDPRIFREALARAGAAPPEAVMVGDSWSSDIEGARASGIRCVWFNRFRDPAPEAGLVPEFSSFRAVRQLERLLAPPRATPRVP